MNKKFLNILFICLVGLFLISAVNAGDDNQTADVLGVDESADYDVVSDAEITELNMTYQVTSDLANNDIQSMFDNANDGDTFEFTSKEYKNISLVVDKKLNIISKVASKVYASNQISDKAESLGIKDTFAFYFTSNSAGSILSGITIISNKTDYGIVLDSSDNTTIKNNVITGGDNCVLVKNVYGAKLTDNQISKAKFNGIQLQNVRYSVILGNNVSYNGRSGIITSDIYSCNITNNTLHHNDFNGISMYNTSNGNTFKYNEAYENPNGIFINSKSTNDVINANTFTYNRKNTSYELGAFESGNGLLFGADFKTSKEGKPGRLEVKYNVLAHNEGYQAKNNPDLPTFKLGDNWFDSNDDEDSFVCPMLLAGIMKMGTISVKNGIGLQMYDTKGEAVKEFGTFDTTVNVDGNQYTAKFINGKAVIDANLDSSKEYDIQVMIGGKPVTMHYKPASGDAGNNQGDDSQSSQDTQSGSESSSSDTTNNQESSSSDDVTTGDENDVNGGETSQDSNSDENNSDNHESSDGSADSNDGNSQKSSSNDKPIGENTADNADLEKGNSTSVHFTNSKHSGNYGTNASGDFKDSSDNGLDAQTNGNANAGDSKTGQDAQTTGNVYAESSNEGEVSKEGKAYEITPESKISKEITDTSGVVVLSIVAILGCLIYGYWRRRDMEY